MLFRRVVSEGLAHYSYIIGDGNEAVVIDPRRDVDVYLEAGPRSGYRITNVLETHCNEDYVVGSPEVAARTGASVWHADSDRSYGYGSPVRDGQQWKIGRLRLQAMSTPGHTEGGMSYLLYDPEGVPWAVFTGDTLMAGDTGRVDLLGDDRAREMAGRLYDSLFGTLLQLDDGVIVCPAHGSGSVCGGAIAERLWTTVGLERRYNPKLQHRERNAFVDHVARPLERPPYFSMMERLNTEGPPVLGSLPVPPPLAPGAFAEESQNAIVLDTRLVPGFGAAHIQGARSIWIDGVPSFAGWFLPYDRPLLLVTEDGQTERAVRFLVRMGYDDVRGVLAGGVLAWQKSGRDTASIRTVTVHRACRMFDEDRSLRLLDVRSDGELRDEGEISGAVHIPVTRLASRLSEVPQNEPLFVFCGTGLRSMMAASLLQLHGWKDVTVVMGGLAAWKSSACPVRHEREPAAVH